MSNLIVTEARIENFRLLREFWMPLRPLTVILGANNCGKTAFLDALGVALGDRASDDDLYVDADGTRKEPFIIDLKVQPANGEEFDDDVRGLLGDAVQLPSTGPEYFAIRTVGNRDTRRGYVSIRRFFLRNWSRSREQASKVQELKKPNVSREALELISFHCLDARRDMVEQLRGRTTYWGRLASDLGIEEGLKGEIEKALSSLSAKILKGSGVLDAIREELGRIAEAFRPEPTEVTVSPLPSRVDDLIRGMDILIRAQGSAPIAMGCQGMGTRSLATLMLFNAFVKIRAAKGKTDIEPLTIVALEEPEAHLHPQAQRAVFRLTAETPGRKIVSTHSPFVTSIADVYDFRVFRRAGSSATVYWVDEKKADGTDMFDSEELNKLQKFVQLRHGEVLFSRVVILFEGDTEESAIPVFANAYWEVRCADQLGVSMVNVGGAGDYRHFVTLLEKFHIPWIILSDGDTAGQKGVAAAGKAIGATLCETSDRVVMLPTDGIGQDLEAYLIAEGYRPQIVVAIGKYFGQSALEDYRKINHDQKRKGGEVRDYQSTGWEEFLVHDYMDSHKGCIGQAIAEQIVETGRPSIPAKYRELFDRVSRMLDRQN